MLLLLQARASDCTCRRCQPSAEYRELREQLRRISARAPADEEDRNRSARRGPGNLRAALQHASYFALFHAGPADLPVTVSPFGVRCNGGSCGWAHCGSPRFRKDRQGRTHPLLPAVGKRVGPGERLCHRLADLPCSALCHGCSASRAARHRRGVFERGNPPGLRDGCHGDLHLRHNARRSERSPHHVRCCQSARTAGSGRAPRAGRGSLRSVCLSTCCRCVCCGCVAAVAAVARPGWPTATQCGR